MPKRSKNANGDRTWLLIMQDLCFEKTLVKCRVQLKGFVCLFLVVWKTFHNNAVLKTERKDVFKWLPLVQRSQSKIVEQEVLRVLRGIGRNSGVY